MGSTEGASAMPRLRMARFMAKLLVASTALPTVLANSENTPSPSLGSWASAPSPPFKPKRSATASCATRITSRTEPAADTASTTLVLPSSSAESTTCFGALCSARMRESTSFNSERGTMASIRPCSSANSAVWKPSGRVCLMVSWITRRPAKPIRACGSEMMMSPCMANDAVTPPVVGSVMMET